MKNSQYEVEVLIHGKPAKEYSQWSNGEYKTFIEGRPGTEYSLRIYNNSNQKLLAIAAIDSINVVTGKVSDGYQDRGYIIQPCGGVLIKGYRESDSTVGAFKFTNKSDSYAKEKGMERNSGVIAVNLIAEKTRPIVVKEIHHHHDHWFPKRWPSSEPDRYYCDSDIPIGSNSSSSFSDTSVTANFASSDENIMKSTAGGHSRKANFDLGSTWGNRVEDKITRKRFEKGAIVAGFKIYYASRRALESMGVEFHPKKEVSDWPEGFESEYAQPPKGWR